ncbi:MAG: hypothetical protein NVSMB12_17390 [Acidimicrobiales bacterium]
MRYQRLILEAGSNAVTVRFHPRLTVVAGVGRGERDMLVTELLGSLAGGRPGAHLELVDDSGRRLALIRPASGGADRVLEVDTGEDVTREFAGADGRSDLLRMLGLSAPEARSQCRLTSSDLAVESQGDHLVSSMAGADQAALWAAADRLLAADRVLAAESKAAGSDVDDAPLIEEIERRHSEFERAQQLNDSVRHHGIFIGGTCPPAAAVAKFALHNAVAGFGFLAVAALTTVVSIVFRRRMEKAQAAEEEALARAGKESYIGFQLQRVDRMLDGQKSLARVAQASEEKRVATEAWRAVGGEVDPAWAIEHRVQIERLAARAAGTAPLDTDINPAELAHWLAARFTALRHVGPTGESLPMILDDPMVGVEPSVKQWILELIGRSAGSPQVIYLTADPDVAAWARIEAMAGHLSVLEPAPDAEAAMPAAQLA